jgi:hypothetical protein
MPIRRLAQFPSVVIFDLKFRPQSKVTLRRRPRAAAINAGHYE